jgi:hypothetical protein
VESSFTVAETLGGVYSPLNFRVRLLTQRRKGAKTRRRKSFAVFAPLREKNFVDSVKLFCYVALNSKQQRSEGNGSQKRKQEVQRRAQRWRQSGKEGRVKVQVQRRHEEVD